MTHNNDHTLHDDITEILDQTRALTTNPEYFYREIISALAHSLSIEQFHTICHAALKVTDDARSLHEA